MTNILVYRMGDDSDDSDKVQRHILYGRFVVIFDEHGDHSNFKPRLREFGAIFNFSITCCGRVRIDQSISPNDDLEELFFRVLSLFMCWRPVAERPEIPPEATTIWRYMPFWQLRSLVQQRMLMLPRLDTLGDPYEGSLPKSAVDVLVKDIGEGARSFWSVFRGWAFVSCWHAADVEHEMPWARYGTRPPTLAKDGTPLDSRGVALRTTVGRLRASGIMAVKPPPFIIRVKYIDFQRAEHDWPYFTPYFYKRREYEADGEVRVIVQTHPTSEGPRAATHPAEFVAIDVDLDVLIEGVVVAPGSSEEFRKEVEDLLRAHGLDKPVLFSSSDPGGAPPPRY